MINPIFNLNTEIWKLIIHIPNIKPYYYISSFGNVYSTASNSLLTQFITENGYNVVGLMLYDGNRILRKVHRLEMIEFMYFNDYEKYEVNHKDGNKQNNKLWNLEWVTSKENTTHAIVTGLRQSNKGENNPKAIYTELEILNIGKLIMSKQYTDIEIMQLTGCNYDTLIGIISGNIWNYLFSDQDRSIMRSGRKGYNISESDKCSICKFYEDNKLINPKYGDVTRLISNALLYLNIENNNTTYRIAKRLYYKHQDGYITSKYNY